MENAELLSFSLLMGLAGSVAGAISCLSVKGLSLLYNYATKADHGS